MKAVLFTCILLILTLFLFAQESYIVTYKIERKAFSSNFPITINGDSVFATLPAKEFYRTLVFNDSFAYSILETERPKKKTYSDGETQFGSKPFHGDYYYDKLQESWLYYSTTHRRKKPILVEYTPKTFNFVAEKDPVQILGMNCKKGYAIMPHGDTVFAIICTDFKNNYGPFAFNCFPGLISEMYQPLHHQYISLLTITGGNYHISIPDVPQMTKTEYQDKYWKNKNYYPGRPGIIIKY